MNNTLCYNLNTVGYTVDSAQTKSVASSFLTKQDYDLIVLDVNLPDGNGFDFCREVKERRPDTAVIFLTANDMESDMLRGYELGVEDYVTKPFPVSVFQKKLSVVLGTVSAALYGLTQNITAVWYVLLFGIFVLLCDVCFMVLVLRKLAMFSDAFCSLMDDMLSGNMQSKQTVEEESLFYKIEYRLNRFYEVMQENKNSIARERADF